MKHDERKDLESLKRVAKVDFSNKTIKLTNRVGISTRGKLDFLCKYCGWTLLSGNNTIEQTDEDDNKSSTPNRVKFVKKKKERNL